MPVRLIGSLFALAMTSCATIIHGTHETLSFDSSPSGASVEVHCQQVTRNGTTPAKIEIPRNATDCIATLAKSGFKSKRVTLERVPAGSYWLNFIGIGVLPFGISDNSPLNINDSAGLALLGSGVFGLAIDAFDGAMFRHDPAVVSVTLEQE
jgi:hypothetical protein